MDGKGAWRDNVFVERLWRSVKYEEVYLRAYESVDEVRTSTPRGSLPHFLAFCSYYRPTDRATDRPDTIAGRTASRGLMNYKITRIAIADVK
jgi:hypothetical protein